jgi:hypothetical protein
MELGRDLQLLSDNTRLIRSVAQTCLSCMLCRSSGQKNEMPLNRMLR